MNKIYSSRETNLDGRKEGYDVGYSETDSVRGRWTAREGNKNFQRLIRIRDLIKLRITALFHFLESNYFEC